LPGTFGRRCISFEVGEPEPGESPDRRYTVTVLRVWSCAFSPLPVPDSPSVDTSDLWEAARGIFEKWPFQPVRLIGATAEQLVRGQQVDLFPDPGHDRQRKLDAVADQASDHPEKRCAETFSPPLDRPMMAYPACTAEKE
jgi:hypothetical protein